jgi:threonine synthase
MSELVCIECGRRFSTSLPIWRCECGGLLDVEHSSFFKIEDLRSRKLDMWRYREAIPIDEDSSIVSLGEGFTPIVELAISGENVLFKQEHLFPTGSFKDRGASVLLSKVKELGIDSVVEDSSGNAGAAVAAYAASAGVQCEIFVPKNTIEAKITQIELYGANLRIVPGSRERTAAEALKAAEGCYYASHSWNPFFSHGTKTMAFELSEQLGWAVPDVVILPVGNGTLLLGACIGFSELKRFGITKRMPRFIGVQVESCAPLHKAYIEGTDEIGLNDTGNTIAEGVAVAKPVRGKQILRAVRSTGGYFITVNERELIDSLKMMLSKGFLIEPTSAVPVAGVVKYLSENSADETIVSVLTGHGLKGAGEIHKLIKNADN